MRECFGREWVSPEIRPECKCATCPSEPLCEEAHIDRVAESREEDWDGMGVSRGRPLRLGRLHGGA